MRNDYQRKEPKSNHKFEDVRGQGLMGNSCNCQIPIILVFARPSA